MDIFCWQSSYYLIYPQIHPIGWGEDTEDEEEAGVPAGSANGAVGWDGSFAGLSHTNSPERWPGPTDLPPWPGVGETEPRKFKQPAQSSPQPPENNTSLMSSPGGDPPSYSESGFARLFCRVEMDSQDWGPQGSLYEQVFWRPWCPWPVCGAGGLWAHLGAWCHRCIRCTWGVGIICMASSAIWSNWEAFFNTSFLVHKVLSEDGF